MTFLANKITVQWNRPIKTGVKSLRPKNDFPVKSMSSLTKES